MIDAPTHTATVKRIVKSRRAVAAEKRVRAAHIERVSLADVGAIAASVQAMMFVLSLALMTLGHYTQDLDIALGAVVVLYASNLIYGFLKIRDRLLFLFLHAGIFLFLLTRPLFAGFFPDRTWFLENVETTWFALDALFLSMVFLLFGCILVGVIASANERARSARAAKRLKMMPSIERRDAGESRRFGFDLVEGSPCRGVFSSQTMRTLRMAALICFFVCLVGAFVDGYIKMSYMSGLAYEEYYLIDSSEHVPWVIDVMRVMTPYLLCAYLATMPRRKPATVCLLLYVAQTFPMLVIGSRSDFVIAFLFAALYYIFRAVTDKSEVWISKRQAAILVVAVPVLVFSMGVMNYTRQTATVTPEFTVVQQMADALFKQGVSFTVLGHGYVVSDQVQSLGFKFYSIGSFITTFTQGFIGQTFFGVPSIPSTNCAEHALLGSSYAHTMSYFAHPNYLGGEGYGSSYILELYADFGVVGIAVGSLIISAALTLLARSVGRSWFWGMIALIGSLSVFHMPRGYAAEWIDFIISTRFIMAMLMLGVVFAVLLVAGKLGIEARLAQTFCGSRWFCREGEGVVSLLGGLNMVQRSDAPVKLVDDTGASCDFPEGIRRNKFDVVVVNSKLNVADR